MLTLRRSSICNLIDAQPIPYRGRCKDHESREHQGIAKKGSCARFQLLLRLKSLFPELIRFLSAYVTPTSPKKTMVLRTTNPLSLPAHINSLKTQQS